MHRTYNGRIPNSEAKAGKSLGCRRIKYPAPRKVLLTPTLPSAPFQIAPYENKVN
jgi:hypothetical protein